MDRSRRNALKNIGLGFGALTATPTVIGLLQSCQTATQVELSYFSQEQFDVVAQLMDIFIPTTDIPGATDLKLPEFLDTYIDAVMDDTAKEGIQEGLNDFIASGLEDNGKEKASQLDAAALEGQLAKYLKGTEAYDRPAAAFASQLQGMTVQAFKVNEFIGEEVLAYAPVPGEQRGCVDLMETTGGKAWSL